MYIDQYRQAISDIDLIVNIDSNDPLVYADSSSNFRWSSSRTDSHENIL